MGEELPDEWPDVDPVKFYCCTVDAFVGGDPLTGCDRPYWASIRCCVFGAILAAWIAGDNECVDGQELCVTGVWTAQRLMSIIGPYDTLNLCRADC